MARDKRLSLRISEFEYKQLKQEAEKQGVAMADVLRRLIAKLPRPTE